MNPHQLPLWLVFGLFSFLGCARERPPTPSPPSLSKEQLKVVGTWHLLKPSERGSVSRELVFHADGVRFTTSCRSTFDDVVANGQGEGTWAVTNGSVRAKWVERQVVPSGAREVPYSLDLRIEEVDGETELVVPDNLDRYRKKP